MKSRVLIVDDEPDMVSNCERILAVSGIQTISTTDPRAGFEAIESERPDVLLTDLKMPGVDGMRLLERARSVDPQMPVIIFTAFATVESAVAAVKEGAFDYLPKPFSADHPRLTVERALRQRRLARENERLRDQLQTAYRFENIIGRSQVMTQVFELIRKAARSEANILVLGESGTGKELVARAIHANSPRAAQAFVAVDCASLPEPLLESELFGHEKGAFTGAADKHTGKFREAHGGTLFLDEVGELPMDIQVKLLRALQDGEIDPVGARRPIRVDFRLISATNQSLIDLVKAGKFREDLYYRLNVFPIRVPPLRERRDDIPALVRHFTARFAAEEGKAFIRAVNAPALQMLSRFDWPGNVRQLENAVFRAVVLTDGPVLTPEEFPQIAAHVDGNAWTAEAARDPAPVAAPEPIDAVELDFGLPQPSEPASVSGQLSALAADGEVRPLAEIEAAMIRLALDRYAGRMTLVARRLGIGRSTLYRKLKELGISDTVTGIAAE